MNKKILNMGLILTMGTMMFAGCSKEDDTTEDKKTTQPPVEVFYASKTASNRVAVLEDFTGVRCGYCPDGHVKAKAAQDLLGKDKFIILAVHGGSYATPATGWANFTTDFGAALIGQSAVAGYPAGTMNRVKAADLGVPAQKTGGLAMSRGSWQAAAEAINGMKSPVNSGAKATFNNATRELKVEVHLYYTGEETVENNINVAFIQDKLMSKQSGAPTNPYEQNHVLRHFITGQWGDPVTETKKVGTMVKKTYTYTVPADYHGTNTEGGGAVIIDNSKVVVFVSRGKTDILTGVEVPITAK